MIKKISRRLMLHLIIVVFILISTSSAFAGYTFTMINVPGAVATVPRGINIFGDIVGNYHDASGASHGFLRRSGEITFTTFDVPGATYTIAYGINTSLNIVGSYYDTSAGAYRGFLRNADGSFTTFAAPGAIGDTDAYGINDAGSIVGAFETSSPYAGDGGPEMLPHGFLRNAGGSFTTINFPVSDSTSARGINSSGNIIGDYTDNIWSENFDCFLRSVEGSYSRIDIPFTPGFPQSASGINDAGDIVGYYSNFDDNYIYKGFLIDVGGTITTIHVPGTSRSEAYGVNSPGVIVGYSSGGGFVASPPADQMINFLINTTNSLDLTKGITTSLDSKLQNAIDAAISADTATACGLMNAFINQVSAQSGKKITAEQAEQLIAIALQIKTALGCL